MPSFDMDIQSSAETKEDKRVEVLHEMYCDMTASELTWAVRAGKYPSTVS